jgi:hypothetical protein
MYFFQAGSGRIFACPARKNRAISPLGWQLAEGFMRRYAAARNCPLQFLDFTYGKACGISASIPCAEEKMGLKPHNTIHDKTRCPGE